MHKNRVMKFNLMKTASVTMEREETFPSDEMRKEENPEGEERGNWQICRLQINTEVKKSGEWERGRGVYGSNRGEKAEWKADLLDLQALIRPWPEAWAVKPWTRQHFWGGLDHGLELSPKHKTLNLDSHRDRPRHYSKTQTLKFNPKHVNTDINSAINITVEVMHHL